ncbi:MAG: TonB family protein [Betaproteobacteria bacterium]|nr:TonB family protein [Betaproteobacteria bacterium]
MTTSESRRLQAILGLSILLHAALFAIMSQPRKPAVPPMIMASIRLVDAPSSGSLAAPAPAPLAIPQKARPDMARAEHRSAPRLTKTAGPANVPAPIAAVTATTEVTPAAVAASAVVAQAAEVPRTPVLDAAMPTQSDVLAGYRQRLTELFARTHEYPRVAAMRGWEGEVRLRLKVARKGNLLGVHLDRSSGFDVLDQDALALLEGHGNLPPLPEALEGNEIQVIVPINYKLRKTT